LQAVNDGYAEVNARMGPYQEVVFEGEKIILDIPKEGIVLENGWTTSLLPKVPITIVIECDMQSTCIVYTLMHSIAAASQAETGNRDSVVRIFVDHYS